MKIINLLLFISIAIFASSINEDIELELVNCEINEVEDIKTRETMNRWQEGSYGLKPYRVNYFLPLAFQKNDYKSYLPMNEYVNYEVEMQVSIKLNVVNNLLGLDEKYYMSYTHTAFWQVYTPSSPFRETNYNPEAFVIFPIKDDTFVHLRSLKFALAHRSNGVGDTKDFVYPEEFSYLENQSRSVNYLYSTLTLQHGSLITDFNFWIRIPELEEEDDNKDLIKYVGQSYVKLRYFTGKHMFTLMGMGNFLTGYGALEATYSHPAPVKDVFFYTKLFTGYGESLIDYNNHITKFAIGFSFSR